MIFKFEVGKYGIKWEFKSAHSAIDDKEYTKEEVYSKLLGVTGSSAS